MKIPPPPPLITTPKPPLFPNARKIQAEKKLGDDIRDLCGRLAKATVLPGWQDVFWRFKAAVAPNGACDSSRLPYRTDGPNSHTGSAIACLLSRLSWIVQCYWRMCVHGTENEAHIRQYLDGVEALLTGDRLEVTLERCDVVGDERHGWWIGT
jgi:hypothetical protein